MQTTIPPFASGTFSGLSAITSKEGTAGYVLTQERSLGMAATHMMLGFIKVFTLSGVVKFLIL